MFFWEKMQTIKVKKTIRNKILHQLVLILPECSIPTFWWRLCVEDDGNDDPTCGISHTLEISSVVVSCKFQQAARRSLSTSSPPYQLQEPHGIPSTNLMCKGSRKFCWSPELRSAPLTGFHRFWPVQAFGTKTIPQICGRCAYQQISTNLHQVRLGS